MREQVWKQIQKQTKKKKGSPILAPKRYQFIAVRATSEKVGLNKFSLHKYQIINTCIFGLFYTSRIM